MSIESRGGKIVAGVFVLGAFATLGYVLFGHGEGSSEKVVTSENGKPTTLKCEKCGATMELSPREYASAMASREKGQMIRCKSCGEAAAWATGGSSGALQATPEEIANARDPDQPEGQGQDEPGQAAEKPKPKMTSSVGMKPSGGGN
jgi:ribosomal protein S27E